MSQLISTPNRVNRSSVPGTRDRDQTFIIMPQLSSAQVSHLLLHLPGEQPLPDSVLLCWPRGPSQPGPQVSPAWLPLAPVSQARAPSSSRNFQAESCLSSSHAGPTATSWSHHVSALMKERGPLAKKSNFLVTPACVRGPKRACSRWRPSKH